jgi:hypothetical protein
MKELIYPSNVAKYGVGVYNIEYLLFLVKQEWEFIKDEPINPNIQRCIKQILEKKQNLQYYLVSRGINHNEVFKEFSEEKRYALHNILTILADLEEVDVLEIENYVLRKKIEKQK